MTIQEKKPAEHVLSFIDSEPWLITESGLEQIREIAARDNLIISIDDLAKIEERREALAAKKAARLAGGDGVTRQDGVAVIDVKGPIFRYANVFNSVSGGTTTETLATDFHAALADRDVEAILFYLDSPGGEAKGIHELANMIAANRGAKPIGGYIGGTAGSAAYWIGCAVEPGLLGIDAIGWAGSVGARLTVKKDLAEAKAGKSVTYEFISKQSPNKGADPETDAGKSELQARADAIGGAFVDDVARHRGVTVEKVLADFGGGRVLMGATAVKAGLVDQVTSMEAMIQALKERRRTGNYGKLPRGAVTSTKEIAMYTKEMKANLGLAETASDVDVDARLQELKGFESKYSTEKDAREKAERKAAETKANAAVDGWERDGVITGDSTKKVREFYVALATGVEVTTEMFDGIIASLPKLGGQRQAADVQPPKVTTDVTLKDFDIAAQDVSAARRIKTAVTERQKTTPKFTRQDLYRELGGK